jgi:5-methylcytosine-specific restriction enzyme B
MSVEFTLRARAFRKERDDVVKAAKGMSPSRIQKYSVEVNGKRLPIRQLVAEFTGIPTIEITSQDAYRILQKFGFEIKIDE